MSVRNMEDQYKRLGRQRDAMLNARRYSALPKLPAYHVNDNGGIVLHGDVDDEDEDENENDEEGGGGDEIAMIKRSIGCGRR